MSNVHGLAAQAKLDDTAVEEMRTWARERIIEHDEVVTEENIDQLVAHELIHFINADGGPRYGNRQSPLWKHVKH